MQLRLPVHPGRLVLFLALTIPAVAADTAADKGWDRVLGTSKTQQVKIHLQDGRTLKGKIQEVGPEGLTLLQGKSVIQVKVAEIVDVTKKSRLKGAMWGAILGAGVSAPIFAASAGSLLDKNNPKVTDRLGMALVGGLFFGGIGSGVGVATGMADTIYRAPTVNGPPKKIEPPIAPR